MSFLSVSAVKDPSQFPPEEDLPPLLSASYSTTVSRSEELVSSVGVQSAFVSEDLVALQTMSLG